MRAVLDDAVVFARGLDGHAAFEGVVRERLFDVDVLAGLAGPNRTERVPEIRRGEENDIDVLVVEELAHVVRGLLHPTAGELLVVVHALGHHALVDVAEGGDLDVGALLERMHGSDMGAAATAQADDGGADAVVGAGAGGEGGRSDEGGAGGGGGGVAHELAAIGALVVHGWRYCNAWIASAGFARLTSVQECEADMPCPRSASECYRLPLATLPALAPETERLSCTIPTLQVQAAADSWQAAPRLQPRPALPRRNPRRHPRSMRSTRRTSSRWRSSEGTSDSRYGASIVLAGTTAPTPSRAETSGRNSTILLHQTAGCGHRPPGRLSLPAYDERAAL